MGILTMSSIAMCLMFQRRNLYIMKVKSLAEIKSVTKPFPTELICIVNKKRKKLFCYRAFFMFLFLFFFKSHW